MNRARVLVIASLLGAASCRDAPAKPTAASCGEAERVELRAWTGTICTEPALVDVRPLAMVPWTERDEIGEGLSIRVEPEAFRIAGGEPVATEPELRVLLYDAVAKQRAWAQSADRVVEPRFVLEIHRDVVLQRVAVVTRALADEGILHGWLAFASSTLPRTPPPRDPELYARAMAEIEGADPAQRAIFLAKKVEGLAERCRAMKDAFDSLATVSPTGRCNALMESVANALVDCGCPEWQPELLAWLQVLGGPADAPLVVANAVELTPAKAERAAPDTTWAAFVATHDAPMRTLWLELAP
jgi:hypothetical protein